VVFKDGAIGLPKLLEMVSAMAQDFNDNIRSMEMVSQLTNVVNRSMALDFDTDHDNVMKREKGLGAVFVSMFLVVCVMPLGDQGKDSS
jgi:hypothetical protein